MQPTPWNCEALLIPSSEMGACCLPTSCLHAKGELATPNLYHRDCLRPCPFIVLPCKRRETARSILKCWYRRGRASLRVR